MQQENEKCEQKLLAFIWQNQQVLPMAMTELEPQFFSQPHTREIFNTLREGYNQIKGALNENVIDIPRPMVYELTQNNMTKNVGDVSQVYKVLVNNVFNNYKKSQVIDLLGNVANDIKNSTNDKIGDILNNINQKASTLSVLGQSSIQQGAADEDALDRKEYYIKIKNNPEMLNLVKSGFKSIDNSGGGFSYGELIYVIGRKGDGKSVLLLNFAYHMWKQEKNVILYSLEMSRQDYMRRFDARAALVPSKGLKLGILNEGDEEKYFHYLENLDKKLSSSGKPVGCFYVVDVPGKCTPAFVDTKTEEIERKLNLKFDCIIIDYSQIMEPNVKTDIKRDNLGAIALDLKRIARSKNKIVMSAAQMTRAGKNETSQRNGHAGTEHVAESDQISDHIDWGLAIRSIDDEEGIIESFKTRDGEPIEFHFTKQFNKMNIIERLEDDWSDINDTNTGS